ncbi:tRNA (adenine(22)-N(1))-methyltransferase TrmK [Ureaplasma ceti]|uniref:Class I SAM-dependent methyltransferase n=1 Tax=Ureaplasma ceti TaxID=3119530 RepID=A0ABP9U7G3_9BACT
MTNRLLAVANLIKSHNHQVSVIDVGSDHAYLSIYLVENGLADRVTNIEVNELPLKNGYENVQKHNLLDKIDFVLNDGFKNLDLKRAIDYVTISGMGATSIMNIVENNLHQVPQYYIVQPNNDVHKLRSFLKNHNYIIDNEEIIYDAGLHYEILKFHKADTTNILDDVDLFVGPVNKVSLTEVKKAYFLQRIKGIERFDLEKISSQLKQEYLVMKEFLEDEKNWTC